MDKSFEDFFTVPDETILPPKQKKRKTLKVSEEEYAEMCKIFPQLVVDKTRRCTHGSCRSYAITGDLYCLRHTRIDFTDCDIPWLCQATNKTKKIRCTRYRLEGGVYCQHHDPNAPFTLNRKIGLEKYYSQPKEDITNNRKENLKKIFDALRSKDSTMWAILPELAFVHPQDVVHLLQETVNRYRWGSISQHHADTLSSLGKCIMDIMVTQKELGFVQPSSEKEEMRQEKAIKLAQEKIVDFSTKLKESLAKRKEEKAEKEEAKNQADQPVEVDNILKSIGEDIT